MEGRCTYDDVEGAPKRKVQKIAVLVVEFSGLPTCVTYFIPPLLLPGSTGAERSAL